MKREKTFRKLTAESTMMIASAVLLLAISSSTSSRVQNDSRKRVKKIANGEPLPSLTVYGTYYYAQLRHTWACNTEQVKHEDILLRCQEDYLRCGGTLINPEFVMTAASCVMYYEVVVKEMDAYEVEKTAHDPTIDIYNFLEQIKGAIVGYVVKPKPKHTVYSDWTLLMGGTDLYKMTQKRHVVNVFPHKIFPYDRSTVNLEKLFQLTRGSWHDVALLQSCLPFDMKKGEVEVAPMLPELTDLRNQYERLVRKGQVCLYVGFGEKTQNETSQEGGPPRFTRNSMQHTWRTTKCYTECNYDRLGYMEDPHTCHFCSWHHGPVLGVGESGDTGGPVTCEGYFVATITRTNIEDYRNFTRTDAYPLHCIQMAVREVRLRYYRTAAPGRYHPLVDRHRRFPPTPD